MISSFLRRMLYLLWFVVVVCLFVCFCKYCIWVLVLLVYVARKNYERQNALISTCTYCFFFFLFSTAVKKIQSFCGGHVIHLLKVLDVHRYIFWHFVSLLWANNLDKEVTKVKGNVKICYYDNLKHPRHKGKLKAEVHLPFIPLLNLAPMVNMLLIPNWRTVLVFCTGPVINTIICTQAKLSINEIGVHFNGSHRSEILQNHFDLPRSNSCYRKPWIYWFQRHHQSNYFREIAMQD